MTFVNYMDEEVDTAAYIEPGVVISNDGNKLITVSEFCSGQNPKDIGPNDWSFAQDEALTKTIGKYWSDYRHRAIEFAKANPETYNSLPLFQEKPN